MSGATASNDLKRLSRWFWPGLCLALVAPAYLPERGAAGYLAFATTCFLAGFSSFAWTTYDQRAVGRGLTAPAKYALIFLGPAFLLPYAFRTRGPRNGVKLILRFGLKLAGVFLLSIAIIVVLSALGLVPNAT